MTRYSCAACPATETHDREFDALQAGWLSVTGWHEAMHGVFFTHLCKDCKPVMAVSLAEQQAFSLGTA